MVIRLNGTKHKPYVKKEEGGGGGNPDNTPWKIKTLLINRPCSPYMFFLFCFFSGDFLFAIDIYVIWIIITMIIYCKDLLPGSKK